MTMTITDQDLLELLPRAPTKQSTTQLGERLARAGKDIDVRSIQRRLIKLSAKYPILCDESSKPYGWSIAKDAPPTLGDISMAEATALKMGQKYLLDTMPFEVVDALKPYFGRADQKLKEAKLYQAWLSKIRLIPPAQVLVRPRIGRNVLQACYDAVLKGQKLHIIYEREAGKTKEYDADPLAIVLRGPVTYLIVRFEWAEDVNLLALHRVRAAKVLDAPIDAAERFDLDAYLESGALGFFPAGEDLLQVHFFDGGANHLLETPFSVNQDLKEVAPGEHILTVKTKITEQLKWWLLGFGERIEVKGPPALRREFRGRTHGAASRYK